MSKKRKRPQTKSERLHNMCYDLVGHVKTLGEQQVRLHDVVMTATAQVNVLANIVDILKDKGIITDEEIKTKIQNAESDESIDSAEEGCDRSETSGSVDEVHPTDSTEESEVPVTAS